MRLLKGVQCAHADILPFHKVQLLFSILSTSSQASWLQYRWSPFTPYTILSKLSSLTIPLSSFLLVLTHPKPKAMFLFLPPRNNPLQRNVFLWSLYPNKYNDLRKQSCFIFSHLSADWANSTEIFCCGGWGAGWLKPLKVFLGAEIVRQSVWSIMWVLQ